MWLCLEDGRGCSGRRSRSRHGLLYLSPSQHGEPLGSFTCVSATKTRLNFQLERTVTHIHPQASTSMNWDEVDWSKFSPEEAHRLRHRMVEERHRGHDVMHAEMILILFGAIAVAQIVLFLWRQKHRKSYQVLVSNQTLQPIHSAPPPSLSPSLSLSHLISCIYVSLSLTHMQAVTLFGLWAIPCYVCLKMLFWRMLSVWFLFTFVTAVVMYRATRRRINTSTPRCVCVFTPRTC